MKKIVCGFWRGQRPFSFSYLRNMGFTRVISLQSGAEDSLTESQYEWERRSGRYQNIIFLSFKWSNFCPPTRSQIKEFIRAYGVHKDKKKTYIHYHSNINRTKIASIAIRIFHQA